MAIRELEAVGTGLDVDALDVLGGVETLHVDFVVEVANVTDDGVVLHLLHVLEHDDVLVSGGGDDDVNSADDVLEADDLEALHAGLESADRVDLSNKSVGTASLHGLGRSLADVTVAADEGGLTGDHDVSGTHDTVREGVLATVQVVELGLGDGVVDVDSREQKPLLLGHLFKTVDAGSGLLGHADDAGGDLGPHLRVDVEGLLKKVKDAVLVIAGSGGRIRLLAGLLEGLFSGNTLVDEEGGISSIVDDHVRSAGLGSRPHERLEGAVPVLRDGLTLPSEDVSGLGGGNGRSGVVLGGEDVARGPTDLGTKSLEGLDEDGGLDGHVQGAGDVGASKRVLALALSADAHKTRHLNLGNIELLAAELGELNVLDKRVLANLEVVKDREVHISCVVASHGLCV
mmetsp:Transcript_17318/g.34925  ORF Transcript_17318/g.34925 Transcript_17318/m.34925 type:complete len:401 (+) Transcript_17318:560-1762(+)